MWTPRGPGTRGARRSREESHRWSCCHGAGLPPPPLRQPPSSPRESLAHAASGVRGKSAVAGRAAMGQTSPRCRHRCLHSRPRVGLAHTAPGIRKKNPTAGPVSTGQACGCRRHRHPHRSPAWAWFTRRPASARRTTSLAPLPPHRPPSAPTTASTVTVDATPAAPAPVPTPFCTA